jgi:cell division protein FtsB
MRWLVEIRERSGDERLLRDVLEASSIRLHEEASKLFLIGDVFEALETAAEVYALASRVQSIVTEIGLADSDILMSFQIGPVVEKVENGERRGHMFIAGRATAFSFATGAASLTMQRGVSLSEADRAQIEEEQKELDYQKKRRRATSRFVSALGDERALQVQRLLQKELTPLTMWHIVELIQVDPGGAIKDLVSSDRLTRFGGSVNHPDVMGEQARHIVSKHTPPPRPMSLDEARAFICDLAACWLARKAGLPPPG